MIKNPHKDSNLWLTLVRNTLIELEYPADLVLEEKSWLTLFDEELHPVKAIMESEELHNLPVAAAYTRVIENNNQPPCLA